MSDTYSDQCRDPTSDPSDNAGPEVGPQDGLVYDEEFWFNDGNIVLVVCTDAFRVHKSVLARSSEIFRDLFAVPQPPSNSLIEGCPVVHISDHPDDVRHLLRALYDGKRFVLGRPEPVGFAEVAALLRLGHKYQIDDLQNAALACMRTYFTKDFAVWKTVAGKNCSSRMQFSASDAVTAVNLARLTDNPSMLPVALYLCCQLSTRTLMNGVPRSNGTIEQLSKEDLELCLDARPRLALQQFRSYDRIYAPIPCDRDPLANFLRCSQLLPEIRKIATTTDSRRGEKPSTVFDILHNRRALSKCRDLCIECQYTLTTRT